MAGIDALLRVMARLRDPEAGCPWDLEQDFASISPHTIEEAYEVDEAIESGDLEALRDELGDLLFQVVFQARIAEEQGAFDFDGVAQAITQKLIRRHPHVFADAVTPASAGEQSARWEAIKAAERAAAGGNEAADPFAGIPRRLPALARSAKIAGRLARRAPPSASDPDDGLASRLASACDRARAALVDAPDAGRRTTKTPDAVRLVGEGLGAWVALARRLGVDPEQALRRADDEAIAEARRRVHQAGSESDR
ncbi:MAG TPA: nucleoside triphosphate pyrophosphohydrolase [Myxococcota bacterium]|nr:nucleoside triphosphate pyrophosphohydrolase [Myxococcales bacterium]HPG26864.1 nucleoside triphosphate pyrophosphohydrolase [Myxococcota bacterium]